MSDTTRIIPGRSWESSQAIEHLKAQPVGTTVTYAQLSAIIRRELPEDGYSYVQSAIRYLLREGQVWQNIPKVGWKRLDDSEIVDAVTGHLRRSRRAARRAETTAHAANMEKLKPEERARLNAGLMTARVVGLFTGKGGREKLIEIGGREQGALPSASAVVDLFRKS